MNISVNGKNFLDIGPAYGDAIDICHEQGAQVIDFIEHDPFFYNWNRLKRFTGAYYLDQWQGISKFLAKKYDLVWTRGAMCVDSIVENPTILSRALKLMEIHSMSSLQELLTELERVASPDCHLLICPFWKNKNGKRCISDIHKPTFTRVMLDYGYIILPFIEGHNHEPDYPVTFYKRIISNTTS